jgi:hypothetical protein
MFQTISMAFALCLTLGIFASLVYNAFFLVHDSENPKFGSLNSRIIWPTESECKRAKVDNFNVKGYNLNYTT